MPDSEYRTRITQNFGAHLADEVIARYPLNGNGDVRDELAAATTDRRWACPTDETRQQLGRTAKVSGFELADRSLPVYLPNLPQFPGGYNAYHSGETILLFEDPGVTPAPAQRQLSDYLIAAWGRFARTGDPGWSSPVQSLVAGASGGTDFARDHQCGFWTANP